MSDPIQKRAVFFIGGYDPKSPEAFFGKMLKEISRFEALWGTKSVNSAVQTSEDGDVGLMTITTEQSGTRTELDFHFLVLDKIVLADFARPLPVRLGRYLVAFADFVASGTAFKIFRSAWRFGLYFAFPFFMVVVFALLGVLVALLAQPWLGWANWLLGLAVFAAAQAVLGQRWPVNHLMDLWSFSRNFMRGNRPDAEDLMQRFAGRIVERVRDGGYDEVILIGHSTGGVLILDVVPRCLALDPNFSDRAEHVAVLTLGSTALKAGYHPAATKFRAGVQRLVDDGKLEWVEIQCLTDIINLYKTNPVAEMSLTPRRGALFPLVRLVRVKEMLEPHVYRRVRRSFFRVHYQYIFGNTRAYWYDFFQICCGPTALIERARHAVVGPGPLETHD